MSKLTNNLIYKYFPFSVNSLKSIINGELWFGIPKNLNDPYEGEFLIKEYKNIPQKMLIEFFYEKHPELCKGKTISSKVKSVLADYSEFHNDVHLALKQRLKEHYGLTSFSYDPQNILMWSHYTDLHKGFCLVFDKSELVRSIMYPWAEFYDVVYNPRLCVAELILESDRITYKNEKEILYSKLDIWHKEKEARMIAIFKPNITTRNIGFDKSCVKGIITGENMLDENIKTLRRLIENDNDYKDVEFKSAIKNLVNKEMDIK